MIRSKFVKVCAYLPVPDEDRAQRARVGQTAGDQERDRVRRVVQRIRLGHRSRTASADLRPSRPGSDPGVRRKLLVDSAAAADRARPRRGLLVGAVDAPGRDLTHPGVRRAAVGSLVLRGAGDRQPRHRPSGPDRAHRQTRPAAGTPSAWGIQDEDPHLRHRGQRQRLLPALPHQTVCGRTGGRCGSRP
jgi:hypothetical protein